MAQKLEEQLKEVGSKLDTPPSSKDALLKLLKQAATCLSELDQSPPAAVLESLHPLFNSIVKPEYLRHQDRDVKLLVATCICEITRITAPEAPYTDDVLKDIFRLIVGTFNGLSDTTGPSFGRRVVILETVAKYRSCVVMLDLECDELVNEMFTTFFAVARDDHPEGVLSSMQRIMALLLEESEDVREDLLLLILSKLGRNKSEHGMAARRLAMSVVEQCAGKLEAKVKQFLIASISGDSKLSNCQIDYHEVIYDIYQCAPQVLAGVVPYLTGELLTDQLDTRLKAVRLAGELFALPGSAISEVFLPIFLEFLKRLTDRVVGVRMSVLEHVNTCLLSNPLRPEAPQIISALCDRLLDYDENVRKQVVAVICDVASHALASVPVEAIKLVAERLRDKAVLVKKYTMERLAELFRVYCLRCSDCSISGNEFDWIPGKILRCFYDKDFRSDTIEFVLYGSLFPSDFPIKDKVKHWIRVFSGFDKVEVKALEKILEQKQRLQQEMQRYLSLRQMHQEGDAPEIQKKILFCFRIMSRSFSEPAKAEENFQILDQLKDANIWKILMNLLDPKTSFHQASAGRDDLLKILGEKHRLYDFLGTLSVKCSYLLFNKEHVNEIFLEAAVQKSAGNTQYILSCIDILVILARFCPSLLGGAEEELVNFLKDDNEMIKEGALHVLAKAGGTIREQLAVSSSSIDLMLERLCLEGSRRQAKYAVHALAAITKDDGLKSLSVLYKRLVDMLEEKTHLPSVLQSLGCIAQTALPVFETRESEIVEFVKDKILRTNDKTEDKENASWDDRTELSLLKIYGIKTLVKSYLPVKDAHLRPSIDGLLEILKNMLSFGEISEEIKSSLVDKSHLRLAAAKAVLRLSRHWDDKIPIDIFHLTLRIPEISFPQAKKLFLGKVHQYVKDRLLDAKYVCAFLFSITGSKLLELEEEKQNLADIIQMLQQAKARQISTQSEANPSITYPELILSYLVHALAHQSCPDVDKCKDVKAYELIYRQLYIVISLLVNKDEDVKSEANNKKEKESISAMVSIFQSIKVSEDIVDATKSKNSHAICDLGLSIIKRLAQKGEELKGLSVSVSLPPSLYKPCEDKAGDDSVASEGQTWLADESVLAHFESLKLETDGSANSGIAEDETLKDSEKDGNEPLGKMLKRLKSQGAKAGKGKKNKSLPAETENAGNDVDILKMVREINLDNLEIPKFESTNGHGPSPNKKPKMDREHKKGGKRKVNDAGSVQVPKRRRSSSAHSSFKISKSTSKLTSKTPGDDSHQESDMDEDIFPDMKDKTPVRKGMPESTSSDLLVSSFQKNKSFLPKHKGKGSSWHQNDEGVESGEADDDDMKRSSVLTESDNKNTNSSLKSSTGSAKKRKRRSLSGLAKCSTKEDESNTDDLIGHKIKIWWPLDKQFYSGTVKSYDPLKKKHVVLYDDGDVEVLRLERERWELIDNGRKATKKLSSLKGSHTEVSPGQKTKSLGASCQIKDQFNIVKGKRTPKKNVKHGQKGAPKTNSGEAENNKERVKNAKSISAPKPYKVDPSDSEWERLDKLDENLTDGEESDKNVKSPSRERSVEDATGSPNCDVGSDDGKKSDSEQKHESISGEAQKSGDNEKSDLNEKEAESSESLNEKEAGSSEGSREEEAHEVDKSDSEQNQEDNEVGSRPTNVKKSNRESSIADDARNAEISDDEPLSMWKHKAMKSSSK